MKLFFAIAALLVAPAVAGTYLRPPCFKVKYDFEEFKAGQTINELEGGVAVSAVKRGGEKGTPMAFDTGAGDDCTGGDTDLCAYDNGIALIISQDDNAHDPNDNAGGGVLTFAFEHEAQVQSMTLLDNEEGCSIDLLDAYGYAVGDSIHVPRTTDGGSTVVYIGVEGVSTMTVQCAGSFGIAEFDVKYCKPPPPPVCVVNQYKLECVESNNPSGKNIPSSPGNGGKNKKQNPDGFYEFGLTNNCSDECVAGTPVTVRDGDGNQFEGEFDTCSTTVKYTQFADGKAPRIKKMGSRPENVKYHLQGSGDMHVSVEVDGTEYTAVCRVPKKPSRFLALFGF